MSLREDISRLKSLLEKKGFHVKVRKVSSHEYRLNVARESMKAEIRVVGREDVIRKLYIKHSDQPGMSILSCEDFKGVAQCIEEALKALESGSR